MLDVEATFCYLGNILCSGGGCDSATAAKYCVAWGKFSKLLPVLTTRHLLPRICSKVYEACVHATMLRSSEVWEPNNPELQQLHCNDCAMIRWICGTKDWHKTLSFTTTETWHWGYYVSPCTKSKEDLGRHGLNVPRLMSVIESWLALPRKADIHGESVFDIAWCC